MDIDPFTFWRFLANQRAFPRLSRMALDIFFIPCISDEPERIFSLAGLLLNKRRARLRSRVVEASECLGHWDRQGFIRICIDRLPEGGEREQTEFDDDIESGSDSEAFDDGVRPAGECFIEGEPMGPLMKETQHQDWMHDQTCIDGGR